MATQTNHRGWELFFNHVHKLPEKTPACHLVVMKINAHTNKKDYVLRGSTAAVGMVYFRLQVLCDVERKRKGSTMMRATCRLLRDLE